MAGGGDVHSEPKAAPTLLPRRGGISGASPELPGKSPSSARGAGAADAGAGAAAGGEATCSTAERRSGRAGSLTVRSQVRTPLEVFRYQTEMASVVGKPSSRREFRLWQVLIWIFMVAIVVLATLLSTLWLEMTMRIGTETGRKHDELFNAIANMWERSSFDLATTLHQQMGVTQALIVQKMLVVPVEVVELSSKLMAARTNLKDIMLHLWDNMEIFSEINSVIYADANGTFVQYWCNLPWWLPSTVVFPGGVDGVRFMEFRADDSMRKQASCGDLCPPMNETWPGYKQYWIVNASTMQPMQEVFVPGGRELYDPRLRPWYLQAEAAKGSASWTDIFTWSTAREMSLKAAQGFFDGEGQMTMVSAVYVDLVELGMALRSSIPPTSAGRVFVIDTQGGMIAASSGPEDVFRKAGDLASRLKWDETGDAMFMCTVRVISRLYDGLANLPSNGTRAMNNDECKCIFSVQAMAPPTHHGIGQLHWLIFNIEPQATYLGAFNATRTRQAREDTEYDEELSDRIANITKKTIGVSVCFVVVGALVVGLIARAVMRPLEAIKSRMQAVAKLDLSELDCEMDDDDNKKAKSSRRQCIESQRCALSIREVAEMKDAFSYMATGLQSFTRYMDPYVVQMLIKSKLPAKLGVAEANVTVFFSDIANFTTIAESLGQEEFMDMFGTYLDEMSDIIMASDGLVGEFIGDAIMAWWNAPLEIGECHTRVALAAALRQQRRLEELRLRWEAAGLPEIRSRMGLVRGWVLAGNVGSTKRMKYGLVGDCVNLASRLESLCKHYGVSILVDGETCDALGVRDSFFLRPVDLVVVKGRQSATELYELVGEKPAPSEDSGCRGDDLEAGDAAFAEDEEQRTFCDEFARAQALYRVRGFSEALEVLTAYRERWPDDIVAQRLEGRCQSLLESPPGADWSPVEVLTHK